MERKNGLDILFTTYAYSKNTIARKFVKRIDKELIPVDKIRTFILLAFPMVLFRKYAHAWNNLFDKWVARNLKNNKSKVFIGWSGMSLHSIHKSKEGGNGDNFGAGFYSYTFPEHDFERRIQKVRKRVFNPSCSYQKRIAGV